MIGGLLDLASYSYFVKLSGGGIRQGVISAGTIKEASKVLKLMYPKCGEFAIEGGKRR